MITLAEKTELYNRCFKKATHLVCGKIFPIKKQRQPDVFENGIREYDDVKMSEYNLIMQWNDESGSTHQVHIAKSERLQINAEFKKAQSISRNYPNVGYNTTSTIKSYGL